MTRRVFLARTRLTLSCVTIFAVVACGGPDRLEINSGLRTYSARLQNLCPASQAVDPVVGTLDGDKLANGDKAWLVADDGRRMHVVWPQGFTLSFQPHAILRNERGRVVAEKGSSVTLIQVNRFDHAGTPDDPYLPLGSLLDGCYAKAM